MVESGAEPGQSGARVCHSAVTLGLGPALWRGANRLPTWALEPGAEHLHGAHSQDGAGRVTVPQHSLPRGAGARAVSNSFHKQGNRERGMK